MSGALAQTTHRARLLQKTLATLCLALGSLIFTSVCIGVGAAMGLNSNFIGLAVLISIAFLFYASILLIRESRFLRSTWKWNTSNTSSHPK